MRKLVLTILKNDSKGLKHFFEANVPNFDIFDILIFLKWAKIDNLLIKIFE
jgi:hypothetical protein